MALEYRLRATKLSGPNGETEKETLKERLTGEEFTSEEEALAYAEALVAGGDYVQVVLQNRDVPDWESGETVGEIPAKPTVCETCGQKLP